MKLFLQDFEALVSKRAHDELSRVRATAEALIERLGEQAKAADEALLAQLDVIRADAAGLVADIEKAVDPYAAENLTLGMIRDLHARAQSIGLV